MSYLILGSSGFLGRNMITYLLQQKDVTEVTFFKKMPLSQRR